MRAVATDGKGGLTPVEVPRPETAPDGASVHVTTCGFCGSDLEKVLDPAFPAGEVLGHEVVGFLRPGRAASADSPVGEREGRRVAVAHHVPCGGCRNCRTGHSSLCDQFTGTELEPGGFAEELVVGPRHLEDAVFPLPDSVDDLAGTLVEPLSCVLRAVDAAAGLLRAFPGPGVSRGGSRGLVEVPRPHLHFGGDHPEDDPAREAKRVAVAGCGSVGLLFLSVLATAKRLGPAAGALRPEELTYLETSRDRAALAEELGAAPLEGRENASDEGADGHVDLAFLTAPAAFDELVRAMRPGGVLVVFAAGRGDVETQLPLGLTYRRELTIAGARSGSPDHLRRALEVLGTDRLPLEWYRPLEVGLDELPRAVERYARGEVLKVVARP